MKREEEIRISILNEAKSCKNGTGTALGYPNDELRNRIARELIEEGFVIGFLDSPLAAITGIRNAGLEYLESKKFHKRAMSRLKKIGVAIYSLALVIFGFLLNYILNLDSVKQFFSDLIGKYLK